MSDTPPDGELEKLEIDLVAWAKARTRPIGGTPVVHYKAASSVGRQADCCGSNSITMLVTRKPEDVTCPHFTKADPPDRLTALDYAWKHASRFDIEDISTLLSNAEQIDRWLNS